MKAKLRGTTGAYFDVVEVDAIHVKDSIPFVRYYADEEGTIYNETVLEFLSEESEQKCEITLEDAILHARHKANELGECECAKHHLQLAEWLEELQALKNLSKVKGEAIEGWVARDADQYSLYLYEHKPGRFSDMWGFCHNCLQLDPTWFPNVTWDSEPKKVRLIITPIEE